MLTIPLLVFFESYLLLRKLSKTRRSTDVYKRQMPEAAVSINSALKGNAGITIGNIVGSNILNILIILGITAVITTVAVQKSTIWIEIPYMMIITVLLLVPVSYTHLDVYKRQQNNCPV